MFAYLYKGRPAIKDTLEALGVPHTEIDAILINQKRAVKFFYQLREGEKVFVYPPGYYKKIAKSGVKHLQAKLPSVVKFVVDSHLGKLARILRLLGFDVIYKKFFPDEHIIHDSLCHKRVILTRDIGLLKNKSVKWGAWIHSLNPLDQTKEVITKYNLMDRLKPFKRCLECNGLIKSIAKKEILHGLHPKTKEYFREFYHCQDCRRVYWKGSHYEKLLKWVEEVKGLR